MISSFPLILVLIKQIRNNVWINKDFAVTMQSIIVTCVISVLSIPYIKELGYDLEVLALLSYFIYYFMNLMINYWYNQSKINYISLLDIISIENLQKEDINERDMFNLICNGFCSGHQCAHSWLLFDFALKSFPNDLSIPIIYCRMAALYSDDHEALINATKVIFQHRKQSFEIKSIIYQIHSLFLQRERTLSTEIKKKIFKLNQFQTECLTKVRQIWEYVMRGNYNIESHVSELRELEEYLYKEYCSLTYMYPNNPAVFKSFAEFLSQVCKNSIEYERVCQMQYKLSIGKKIRKERCFCLASSEIRHIPSEEYHVNVSKPKTSQVFSHSEHSQTSQFNATKDYHLVSNNEKHIEGIISSIKLPILQKAPLLLIGICCLMLQSIVPPFLVSVTNNIDYSIDNIMLLNSLSKIELMFFDLSFSSIGYIRCIESQIPIVATFNSCFEMANVEYKVHELLKETLKMESYLKRISSDELFSPIIKKVYKKSNHSTNYLDNIYNFASLQSMIVTITSSALQILEGTTSSLKGDQIIIALFRDIQSFLPIFDEITKKFIEIMGIEKTDYVKSIRYKLIISMSAAIVTGLVIIGYIALSLIKEKKLLFGSFSSIPKSVIQKAINDISSHDSDKGSSFTSNQEENTLKTLSSLSKGKNLMLELIDVLILVLLCLFSALFMCYSLFFMPYSFKEIINNDGSISTKVIKPHIYITIALINEMNILYGNNSSILPLDIDIQKLANSSTALLKLIPYSLFEIRSNSNEDYSKIMTSDNCDNNTPIGSEQTCLSYETSIIILQDSLLHLVLNVQNGQIDNFNSIIASVHEWINTRSLSSVLDDIFGHINLRMNTSKNTFNQNFIVPNIVLLGLIFICGLIFYNIFYSLGINAQWSLKLFLFCNPESILNSPPLMRILSNDFTENKKNKNNKAIDSLSNFEHLVSKLLDAVFFLNNKLDVLSCNSAVEQLLGRDPHSIIGLKIIDVLKPAEGKANLINHFFESLSAALESQKVPTFESEIEIPRDQISSCSLKVNVVAVSSTGSVIMSPVPKESIAFFTMTISDISQSKASNRLLNEEHKKGSDLLSTILPNSIAKRLQRGEKLISFSVPNASIAFIDIVSFTPWCGSLPANVVMSTLNKLFSLYDSLLSKYSTLTKIKCIGDCYMVAGGLFNDISQPSLYATQLIDFCLDLLSSMSFFNTENNTNLKIRIGINSGGPIVAGVLGTEKPTFDILGSPVSVAAAMEHNGIPMTIHIPNSVLDLVYQAGYKVYGERQILIKGEIVTTYLIK